MPFLRQAQGRIINIASVLGYTGFPVASLYSASKYAVEGLSESLLYELAPHGVQVAVVEPGRHKTEFGNNLLLFDCEYLHNETYQQQMSNYTELLENKRFKISGNVQKAARRVFKLANRRKMPFKTRIGLDAQLSYWGRRLLPEKAYYCLLRWGYARLLVRHSGK